MIDQLGPDDQQALREQLRQQRQRRMSNPIVIVIGNTYAKRGWEHRPCDVSARKLVSTFQDLGLGQVEEAWIDPPFGKNGTTLLEKIEQTIGRRCSEADIDGAIFCFAGHGVANKFKGSDNEFCMYDDVLKKLDTRDLKNLPKLVVFDCCLFKHGAPAHRMAIPADTLVVTSAKLNQGSTTTDEDGADYSAYLAKELRNNLGHSIRQVLKSTARRVKELVGQAPRASALLGLVPSITSLDDTTSFDDVLLGPA